MGEGAAASKQIVELATVLDAIGREAETIDDLRKRTRAMRRALAKFERPRPPSVGAFSQWYGMSGFMLGAIVMMTLAGLVIVVAAR